MRSVEVSTERPQSHEWLPLHRYLLQGSVSLVANMYDVLSAHPREQGGESQCHCGNGYHHQPFNDDVVLKMVLLSRTHQWQ